MRRLAESLNAWKDCTPAVEQAGVLKAMQQELKGLQAKNRDLLEQKVAYERARSELRHERQALRAELARLSERLADYGDLERYLHYLGRFAIYTRTRMEFEQSISELTPEQEQAISAVSMKKDFLIKGGAGTGKSLVLIEALKRSLEQQELEFQSGEVVFVTFTRTLARIRRTRASGRSVTSSSTRSRTSCRST